jgi:hypothetical protein
MNHSKSGISRTAIKLATSNEQQARKSDYNCHTTSKKLLPEFCHSCRVVASLLAFYVRAQKYSYEQSLAAIYRCASTAMNTDKST